MRAAFIKETNEYNPKYPSLRVLEAALLVALIEMVKECPPMMDEMANEIWDLLHTLQNYQISSI